MLPNHSNDTGMPRIASDRKVMKTDRMEGERERKIELGEERRWERHKGDDEHTGKSKPSNRNFYQNQHPVFVAYRFRFIEMKTGEL